MIKTKVKFLEGRLLSS